MAYRTLGTFDMASIKAAVRDENMNCTMRIIDNKPADIADNMGEAVAAAFVDDSFFGNPSFVAVDLAVDLAAGLEEHNYFHTDG